VPGEPAGRLVGCRSRSELGLGDLPDEGDQFGTLPGREHPIDNHRCVSFVGFRMADVISTVRQTVRRNWLERSVERAADPAATTLLRWSRTWRSCPETS